MSTDRLTLLDHHLNGREALRAILATSVYGSAEQAIASLTLFTHPDTVKQIPGGGALFPAVRRAHLRRTLGTIGERPVGYDDNAVPQHVFAWCNGLEGPGRDTQLNHIHVRSLDPDAFSAPANLCVCPSFLAKLTDHDQDVGALLKRRSFELYSWTPADEPEPSKPAGYDALTWAAPLPAILELETVLRAHMATKPASTAVKIARDIGWAFSGGRPDPAFASFSSSAARGLEQ